MSSGASSNNGDGGGVIKVPIVHQYAAIRARQHEIVYAEGLPGPVLPAPTARRRGYAICVRYANGAWFLSSILPPDGGLLSPYPEAAMRFAPARRPAALVAHIPALHDKACRNEAAIVEIGPGNPA